MLNHTVLTAEDFEAVLAPEWDALVADSPTATPFQTREWIAAWYRHLGSGRQPHVICLREGKDLVGLMPMVKTLIPWRSLRTMGSGVSDRLHPLVRRGYEAEVAASLWEHWDSVRGVDLIDVQQIGAGSALVEGRFGDLSPFGGLQSGPVRREGDRSTTHLVLDEVCYRLDLPESWDAYLGGLGKSLRYEARRLDKAPYTTGDAIIQMPSTPDEVRTGLQALFDLHGKRWRKRGLPGVFALPRTRKFHIEYAQRAAALGRLKLALLEVRGEILGAIYAMGVNETVCFYQSGFDPSAKALSPGTVLVAHSIREAIRSGASTFDFLRGAEDYKLRWGPQHAEPNVRLMLSRTRPLGITGGAINRLRGQVEARIRTRLAQRA